VAHLLAEIALRRWIATLPLATLEAVFEAPSSLPEVILPDVGVEARKRSEATLRSGAGKRASLSRWAPRERARALAQRAFDLGQADVVDGIVEREFGGFRGAESPRSRLARRLARRARAFGGAWRTSLLDRLRDHQIRNNRHVTMAARTQARPDSKSPA
jgi:hypothetical protein